MGPGGGGGGHIHGPKNFDTGTGVSYRVLVARTVYYHSSFAYNSNAVHNKCIIILILYTQYREGLLRKHNTTI